MKRLLVLIFVALYGVQIASPLRLNTDACRFLSMALSAASGHGFLVDGKPDVFPEGYPVLLAGLIRLGLGSARWINAFDILSSLAAAFAFYALLERLPGRSFVALLPLASWVWIKHAIIPLSENPYCALSFGALLALKRTWETRGSKEAAGWLALGLLLALGAWRVRSVGVSLLGAVAFTGAAVWLPRSRKVCVLLAVGVLLAAAAGAVLWHWKVSAAARQGRPDYFLQQRAVSALTVEAHTDELGEVVLNVPATRFPGLRCAFLGVGALALALAAAGLPRLARFSPPLAAYLVLYTGILLFWPFYDPRFWMPIWPVLALAMGLACRRGRRFAAGYLVYFLALGLVALAMSARLSLSGVRFARLYGDQSVRNAYLAAFGMPPDASAPPAEERWVRLLRRFEPLAGENP